MRQNFRNNIAIMFDEINAPKVFISYSWDNENHKIWVAKLATRLRLDGIDVTIDHWKLVLGDPIPEFIESAIRETDFVLIVCTPNYKMKSDGRLGGVGYEGHIITAELSTSRNHRKFIPILREGDWLAAAPTWLLGKLYVDFSDQHFDSNYDELLRTLYNQSIPLPPIGKQFKEVSTSKELNPNKIDNAAENKSVEVKPLIYGYNLIEIAGAVPKMFFRYLNVERKSMEVTVTNRDTRAGIFEINVLFVVPNGWIKIKEFNPVYFIHLKPSESHIFKLIPSDTDRTADNNKNQIYIHGDREISVRVLMTDNPICKDLKKIFFTERDLEQDYFNADSEV